MIDKKPYPDKLIDTLAYDVACWEMAMIQNVINIFSAVRPQTSDEHNINWDDVPPPDGVIEKVRVQLNKITNIPSHYSAYFNQFRGIFSTPECDEWRTMQRALWERQRKHYESQTTASAGCVTEAGEIKASLLPRYTIISERCEQCNARLNPFLGPFNMAKGMIVCQACYAIKN